MSKQTRKAPPNILLITADQFRWDALGCMGNPAIWTPNLDALAKDSLVFSDLWATGTRTVRGLEALSLSVPPTPGETPSILHKVPLAPWLSMFAGKASIWKPSMPPGIGNGSRVTPSTAS